MSADQAGMIKELSQMGLWPSLESRAKQKEMRKDVQNNKS